MKEVDEEKPEVLFDSRFEMPVKHACPEEKEAPYLAHSAVGNHAYLVSARYPECGERQCSDADKGGGLDMVQPSGSCQKPVEHHEKHRGHEQSPEEPERAGEKFVVSCHSREHLHQARAAECHE